MADCNKKRRKKDPIGAAARTKANKQRNLATQARRKLAKLMKTLRWGKRNNVRGSSCHEIRQAVRERRGTLASI